jgi:ankyrin repeat protein
MRIYKQKNILERNINYSNAYSRNLLQEAIVSCENAIAVDLVNKGIDIDHQDKKEMSPLDFAKQIKDMEMINILTDKKSKF